MSEIMDSDRPKLHPVPGVIILGTDPLPCYPPAERWHPVSERPTRDGMYLIYTKAGDGDCAMWNCHEEQWQKHPCASTVVHLLAVTHWRPLPPPPE